MSRRKRNVAVKPKTTGNAAAAPGAIDDVDLRDAAAVADAMIAIEADEHPDDPEASDAVAAAISREIEAARASEESYSIEAAGESDATRENETSAGIEASNAGEALDADDSSPAELVDEETRNPYAVLAEYEQRSFAHVAASAAQVQAPGLWRGIAFRIGARRLMASITEVSEILPVLHHTSVPGTQPWLLGVVNVRGTLVPLVDLRGYIEGGRTPLGDTSRMLVARHGSNAIGLLVEEVLGQRNLTAENDPLKLENDAANWARFVPAHFELDGKLWGVFSMAALVTAPDFLHAAA